MDVTMRNPAVTAPSQMPRINRTAKRPPKFVHAACVQRATDQIKIFMLGNELSKIMTELDSWTHLIHFPTGKRCKARF